MAVHELAGKPAPQEILANIPRLVSGYYQYEPDLNNPDHQVSFGTSGHRGTSLERTFNENHILAITQAICDYRRSKNITGPLFMGMDTHALSEAAFGTALEVFAGNGAELFIQEGSGYTPTPVISHAILTFNKQNPRSRADGVVITPSHNPPEDGGFKYNPPTGGPADAEITNQIQDRANQILADSLKGVKHITLRNAINAPGTHTRDFIIPYVNDLKNVINMEAISSAGLKIGVDPMGGSGIAYWEPIAEKYNLKIEIVNRKIDPTFSFMRVDKDGKIRMDCSSPYAMAGLIDLRDNFDIAFGNDPDYDRHGIVTREAGLMNPNHYLTVAVEYLFSNRPEWPDTARIGKTLVSSSMLDRVAGKLKRELTEVPVGFKWFVGGLLSGDLGFGGEESAGASFLRKNGQTWTTDKDGIIMDLVAAEIMAVTRKDPAVRYRELKEELGEPVYKRIDAPANTEQKAALKKLSPESVEATRLAGEKITGKLTEAPGNNAPIGGLKVVTENGWFAARPSGTEDIYKIYAESFKGEHQLELILEEAQSIVKMAFKVAGV